MSNKIKLIIGVLLAGLLLTGCSSSNEASPTVTVTEAAPDIQEDPAYSDEEAYLYALESAAPDFYYSYQDSDLVDLGWVICESLDAGLSFEDIIYAGVDSGVDAYGVGASIGAAVSTLCTQHYAAAEAWLNDMGY